MIYLKNIARLKLALFFLLQHVTLFAQTGPAGIGNVSNNGIWLRAGDINQANASAVNLWSDFSGNANDALQATVNLQPLFYTSSAMNNQPIVRFDGGNDEMAILDANILDGTAGITYYAALRPNNLSGAPRGILGKRITFTTSVEYAYTWFFWNGNRLYNDIHTQNNRYNSGSNTFSNATNYILSFDYDGSLPAGQRSRMFSQGSLVALANENSTTLPNSNQDVALGALNVGYGTYLGADYGEIIHFNYSLDSVEHILIQNYLSAKYDIALNTHDYYNEDDPANGNYDFEVAGIGQVSAGIRHDDSQGSAILRINNPTDLGDNEYMIWGHDNGIQQAVDFSDVPAGVQARFERVWRASEVDDSGSAVDVGAIDISFDLTTLGAVTESDLRLLVDRNNNGLFADDVPISGATNIGGNVYQFANIPDIQDNYRFTLGTINSNQTPLPIELVYFSASLLTDRTAQLSWKTASEVNTDYFIVERSMDGSEWTRLDSLKSTGSSNSQSTYNTIDSFPYFGTTYYRLVQVDQDGQTEIFGPRSVELSSEQLFEIFPNPASSTVMLNLHNRTVSILITDVRGRVMNSYNKVKASTFELDVSNYPKGVYFIKFETDKVLLTEKLIVN